MKKKMYLAAAGLIFGGCLLGIGLEATVRAAGGGAGNRLVLSAEETACESGEALSAKELRQREEERRRETEESFRIYEEFGLTYDKEQNRFFYDGKQVRHFNDQIGESSNAFHHEEGVIDVIPIRNERGELTGLRQASEEEFAERTKQQEAARACFSADLAEDSCMEVGEMDFAGYEIYEPFGLTYTKDGLMFEGEPVRYFLDGVEIAEGCMTARHQYLNEKGTVDVHTVRTVIDNGDGSYDPFGDLIRLEKYSEEEFLERDLEIFSASLEAVTTADQAERGGFLEWLFGRKDQGESFAERFEKYRDFGITYVEADEGSGVGNVYYNGKLVSNFVDQSPEGGIFSFHSGGGKGTADAGEVDRADGRGGIDVQTVYDDRGRICGIERAE